METTRILLNEFVLMHEITDKVGSFLKNVYCKIKEAVEGHECTRSESIWHITEYLLIYMLTHYAQSPCKDSLLAPD